MDISSLFQTIHKPVMYEDLVPLKDILPEEAKTTAEYLEKDINNLYHIPNSFTPYCYFKDAIFVEIHAIDLPFLKSFQIKERINAQEKATKEWIKKNDFGRLFALIDHKVAFITYRALYNQIPDNRKYDVFIQIYTDGEYGFSYFEPEFIKDIVSHKTPNKDNIRRKLKLKEDYLTIYRGVGEASASLEKAYSWSLDLNKAIFFATRFGIGGQVYEAKVHIDNVIDYINSRNEKEILTLPENIEEPKLMNFINFESIIGDLEDSGYLEDYYFHVGEIDPDFFEDPDGIHGMTHAKRVLLLTAALCFLNNVEPRDAQILYRVAAFHDIGRDHDGTCITHGALSYTKLIDLGILEADEEFMEYVRYIMENHCIDDDKAFASVVNYDVDHDKAIELLKLFKDADNLDRVRTHDLDIKYLRNLHSVSLVLYAHELLKGVK